MDDIAYRDLFMRNELVVSIELTNDVDNSPLDADCYSAEDISAWHLGSWHYVTVRALICWRGVVIGTDTLSGVEHGEMPEAGYVDALVVVAPVTTDATIISGSPAGSTVDAALDEAEAWLDTLRDDAAELLAPAREWLAAQTSAAVV